MPKYVFTYRSPLDAIESDPDSVAPWIAWFGKIKDSVVDLGQPVSESRRVGNAAAETLTGYSVIGADDLDAALAIAESCPAIGRGFGVEVGELIEMEHASL
jgi:hypothetical protein